MSEISSAIKMICEEKGLSYEAVLQTIESALAAAYRKDFGEKNQNIKVEFDPEASKSKVFDVKTVVEDMSEEELEELEKKKEGEPEKQKEAGEETEETRRFNAKTEIQISDAKLLKKTAKLDDEIKIKLDAPAEYGRMAAQTAKQVIIQRLREAEREMIFQEFKDKEHEVISGVVQRREGGLVLVDLGKATGILPSEEQIYGERYNSGDRIKVYVKEIRTTSKGPEIILSRTSEEILRKVFYLEIPEISNGLIELKSVAREAGSRSKVAVTTNSDKVDPIGSCVGQRGARIQTIINELGGEKVDIIEHDDDPAKYITNSLSPAKIINVDVDKKEGKALTLVDDDQLSLAIGKGGQNVRLAARLTGWKIDIITTNQMEEQKKEKSKEQKEDKKEQKEKSKEQKEDKKEQKEGEKEEKKEAKAKKEKKKK